MLDEQHTLHDREHDPMGKFASQTSVPADRSRGEIERTLARYGASQFAYGWSGDTALIGFTVDGRSIRMELPLPSRGEDRFRRTPARRQRRSPEQAEAAWEQATRQSWRALLLVVKAKLEAIESGIATFEDEFLAYMVVPGGRTVGQMLAPELDEIRRTGQLPALLPALPNPDRESP